MLEQSTEHRIREVENIGILLQANIKTISEDISYMKRMFERISEDSLKIAELSAKVSQIAVLENRINELSSEVSRVNSDLISMRSKHEICVLGRHEEGSVLKDLTTKLGNLQTNYQEIKMSLDALQTSKNKVENIFWKWFERLGWLFVASLLLLIIDHKVDLKTKAEQPKQKVQVESVQE